MAYYRVRRTGEQIQNGTELYHHGILGQKWGKQNGPPYPLGKSQMSKREIKAEQKAYRKAQTIDTLVARKIPKGATFYRVAVSDKVDGPTYVSFAKPERDLYRGSYATTLSEQQGGKPVQEYEFQTTKELNVPSQKEVRQVIDDVVTSDPKCVTEIGASYARRVLPNYEGFSKEETLFAEKEYQEISTKLKSDSDMSTAYKEVNKILKQRNPKLSDAEIEGVHYEVDQYAEWVKEGKRIVKDNPNNSRSFTVEAALGDSPYTKNKVISALQERGYSAMYDNASIGVDGYTSNVREGYSPLILFDGASSMTKVGSTAITKSSMQIADQDYKKWKDSLKF